MDSANGSLFTGNETDFVHPSQLDYIVIDSKKALVIPALMFALGVFGNALGIASLLMYKYRNVRPSHSPGTCSSVYIPSPNLRENQNEYAQDLALELQDRRHSAMRNKNDVSAYKRRRRKHAFGPFHTLVLALISVDLVGNVATSPVTLYLYSTNTTILAAGGDQLCNYSAFAMMFLGIVTMASLTSMAVERVLSIQCPYFYHRHVTSRTANIAIFIIIFSCAIFSLLPVVGFGKIRPMFPYTWCFADWQAEQPKDMAFNYIYATSGILMIVTTLICNVTVVVGLFKMKCRIPSSLHRKSTIRRETQMIIQLIVMTFIYLVCWLPLMIRILDNQLTRERHGEQDRIAIWLAAANPILDPWVYILLRRSVVKRLVHFAKSTCSSRVQSKLTIVVDPATLSNNNLSNVRLSQKELEAFVSPTALHPLCDSVPSASCLGARRLEESRELSSSFQSLYDNAPLSD